jgi:hypothetical protein
LSKPPLILQKNGAAILDADVLKRVPFMRWLSLPGSKRNAPIPYMFRYNFVRRWTDGSKKGSFSSALWQRCLRPRGSF